MVGGGALNSQGMSDTCMERKPEMGRAKARETTCGGRLTTPLVEESEKGRREDGVRLSGMGRAKETEGHTLGVGGGQGKGGNTWEALERTTRRVRMLRKSGFVKQFARRTWSRMTTSVKLEVWMCNVLVMHSVFVLRCVVNRTCLAWLGVAQPC